MSVLFRGTRENFNPQIHTEANSLTYNMRKHFEVRRKSLDLFSRYNKFTSFMYASGRFNGGASAGKVQAAAKEGIMDNAYRIAYEGSLLLPAYTMGGAQIGSWYDAGNSSPDMSSVTTVTYTNGILSSTVTTDVPASIHIKHDPDNEIYGDKFNPNDAVMLGQGLGLLFIIQQHPRRSSDGSHYVLDGKFVGNASLFSASHLAANEVLTEAGNYFGEGSLRGWSRYTRTKWRINYSSIHRTSVTMTGSAKKQKVCNIVNPANGATMWEYEELLKNDELHNLQNELACRYSRMSMDPTGHTWFENYGSNKLTLSGFRAESGLTSPMLGDGWIPQIEDNFVFDYNPNTGLDYKAIEAILMVFGQRSPLGATGNTFVGVTDTIGAMVMDNAMKKLMGFGNNATSATAGLATNLVTNIRNGQDNEIGFTVNKYNYLGNTFVIIQDELLNHPGLFNTSGGVTGTGNIYILNASTVDGVSNFELFSRSGRSLIRKNENGMHSFDESQDSGSVASSGFDGCSIHTLSELLPILYDIRSCGIIKATTKYNGGSLSDHSIANGNNQAASFLF